MNRMFLPALLLALGFAARSHADELPGVDRRFADGKIEEVPHFQRHVVPLLGRLGCNGRACHGSFQGQGGFRLSLFGYDFKEDHKALTAGELPRVDLKNTADSLLLRKPTKTVSHKGGRLVDPGSWQFHILKKWIDAGAPAVKDEDPDFVSLEVEPKEILFKKAGDGAKLRIVANWSNGLREDVTALCRFRSNDESIAAVDELGAITAKEGGGTAVIVLYDNGVVPVTVLVPVSDRVGANYPKVPTPTRIDELVIQRLTKLGIVPSDVCTDEEFLRRVSLDMVGTLPAPAEILAFLADKSADKRARKIDELLARPTYAAWWTTKLCDLTGNSDKNGQLGGEAGLNRDKSRLWYEWIHRRVSENQPYDQLVAGILLAKGKGLEQSYKEYCEEMVSYYRKTETADFSKRDTMPYFWVRRSVGSSDGKALSVAHAFLGVSLQCAQCHKHPFDQWTKSDFESFSAFFNGVRSTNGDGKLAPAMKKEIGLVGDEDSGAYKKKLADLAYSGKLVPFKDLTVPAKQKVVKNARPNPKLGRVITPKLLGGDEVVAGRFDDPRQPIMDWMRQADNPYFARAFVNRVWAGYFSVGIIDPPDDLNLANAPSNPELLDYLTQGFVKSGYDMKWLHRTIANSRTYQLSFRPNETNKLDERNFSRSVLRRLPAEVTVDAIAYAAAADDSRAAWEKDPIRTRAIGLSSNLSGFKDSNYAVTLFGKPTRLINCDCERSSEPTLLQTVYLRNDQEVHKQLSIKNGWMLQVAKSKESDTGKLIREAYLRTLSRLPTSAEAAIAAEHFEKAGSAAAGLRDLMWVLLNTKEFILNH